MTTDLVFSVETMKSCNGNASGDADYFRFFKAECFRRIQDASTTLHGLANGSIAFDLNSEALARASIAEIRRTEDALKSCVVSFAKKPAIREQFSEILHSEDARLRGAESNFDMTKRFLGIV